MHFLERLRDKCSDSLYRFDNHCEHLGLTDRLVRAPVEWHLSEKRYLLVDLQL